MHPINIENEGFVFNLCFPFPEFQVGHAAFDGTNDYIIFHIWHYLQSKTMSAFFERLLCLYFKAKTPK